jgi:hypothetical protein
MGCLKSIRGVLGIGVRASCLQDKELEFFHKRFLEMNYWRKVGIILFGKTIRGAGCKLLGK